MATLEDQLKSAHDLIECLKKDLHTARQERNDLDRIRHSLLEALRKHGQHAEHCNDPDDPQSECYCGLEEVLRLSGEKTPHFQPLLTVKLQSYPESNGRRNWTATINRVGKWGGLIGNCGGITVARGEKWNRVAYEAERAKLLIGERDTEPHLLDYGADIDTPDQWLGEVRGGRPVDGE